MTMRNRNFGITLVAIVAAGLTGIGCTANPDGLGNKMAAIGEPCDNQNTFCAQGVCAGGKCQCTNDNQCPAQGQRCVAGACVGGTTPSTCNDGIPNGDETATDCGGSCAAPPINKTCGEGKSCKVSGDCASELICKSNVCTLVKQPTCGDGERNGQETEVDCGGGVCPSCANGKRCIEDRDCQSRICRNNFCQAPQCGGNLQPCCNGTCNDQNLECVPNGNTMECRQKGGGVVSCNDGVKNGSETDVDCGGNCQPCGDGRKCVGNSDCVSVICLSGVCKSAPNCNDGLQNNDESDVDCGGNACFPCVNGRKCGSKWDCGSLFCSVNNVCANAPSCFDGLKNGFESDVDCGGGTCAKCPDNRTCGSNGDCASGTCAQNVCKQPIPQCNDGLKNGNETDVDCGGGTCAKCSDGKLCLQASDCQSGQCSGNRCTQPGGGNCGAIGQPCCANNMCPFSGICGGNNTCQVQGGNSCNDGLKNGNETDVDCGGGACPQCANGRACSVVQDCASGFCASGFCAGQCNQVGNACTTANNQPGQINAQCVCVAVAQPSCQDGKKNGNETDVDCGGGCPNACGVTLGCVGNNDCLSKVCSGGKCQPPPNPNPVAYNTSVSDVGFRNTFCPGGAVTFKAWSVSNEFGPANPLSFTLWLPANTIDYTGLVGHCNGKEVGAGKLTIGHTAAQDGVRVMVNQQDYSQWTTACEDVYAEQKYGQPAGSIVKYFIDMGRTGKRCPP
jgi:hypothetical protein